MKRALTALAAVAVAGAITEMDSPHANAAAAPGAVVDVIHRAAR
ncbi:MULTISPECIES: hypothetical protein [Amycolatopsis]|nr:hypothetical protein [Amycolatopsis bullii]